MSMLHVTVIDEQQAIWGAVHGGVAHHLVASLSDEPATIEELKTALARFEKPCDVSVFDFFDKGICEEPYDAGVLIIDLRNQVVAEEQRYFALTCQGEVAYHDGQHATDVLIPYLLSENWQLLSSVDEWKALHR